MSDAPASSPPIPLGPERLVAIVEDDLEIQKIIASHVRSMGLTPKFYGDALDAMEVMKSFVFVAVISDHQLGDDDRATGVDVLLSAQQNQPPECLRVLISGYVGHPKVLAALRDNICHMFLEKPFKRATLVGALAPFLRRG